MSPESPRPRFPLRRLLLAAGGVITVAAVGCASAFVCVPAWIRYGMTVEQCPAGRPAPIAWLDVSGLRRGAWHPVNVGAGARWTPGDADLAWVEELRPGRGIALSLVDEAGDTHEVEVRDGWDRSWRRSRQAEIRLPADLPDGDYTLRAAVDSRVGEAEVEAKLPLYAPARIHVLTDRPLYEPGNEVLFRALALRAADLTPLAGRPGTWEVRDPQGTLIMEERVTTDEWGVVAGRLPLDGQAPTGAWTVAWVSGEDEARATVQVEPFTLPRFRVEASAPSPWYGPGDSPVLSGRVVYASGAPVADAALRVTWSVAGDWPPPTAWTAETTAPGEGLPRSGTTDRRGAFTLDLPAVPADLQGQATLTARIEAVDPAGDRVTGAGRVLLSEDPVVIEAVSELGEGLVDGFNNRVYLRATTPDGRPLPGATLTVARAWDPTDPGETVTADVDGVAAMQVDPGPPVSVTLPAPPVRPPPKRPAVELLSVRDRVAGLADPGMVGPGVSLADQRALDASLPDLAPCARFANGIATEQVVLQVSPSGAVRPLLADTPVQRECLAAQLRGLRLPPGDERLLEAELRFSDRDLPDLAVTSQRFPAGAEDLTGPLDVLTDDVRTCLPDDVPAGDLPFLLKWERPAGERATRARLVPTGRPTTVPGGVLSCLESRISGRFLAGRAPAEVDEVGYARLSTRPAARTRTATPQPQVISGYELAVSVALPGPGDAAPENLGSTTLVLPEGRVPDLRLRAEPILPEVGGSVTLTFLRGPDWRGELPEELDLVHQSGARLEAGVDAERRSVTYDLPDDLDGWFTARWDQAEARVFVRPAGSLSVEVGSDRPAYAPGDTATVTVQTRQGDAPARAAVALVGVDESLGQLVTLPGPDALSGLQDPVTTPAPAFGALDGQALAQGRIRGANAAAATVLRVGSVPTPADTDRAVSTSSETPFDPVAVLTDRFYVVLGALHGRVRTWEQAAPEGEVLTNETLAGLWREARDAAEDAGHDVTDAYGRPLRLHWLPEDLLALTDPRAVVVDGTRLPEDIEPWIPWVREEEPR